MCFWTQNSRASHTHTQCRYNIDATNGSRFVFTNTVDEWRCAEKLHKSIGTLFIPCTCVYKTAVSLILRSIKIIWSQLQLLFSEIRDTRASARRILLRREPRNSSIKKKRRICFRRSKIKIIIEHIAKLTIFEVPTCTRA